jgi:hypothetical protein
MVGASAGKQCAVPSTPLTRAQPSRSCKRRRPTISLLVLPTDILERILELISAPYR